MNLKNLIRTIPNYPKPGIMFRDITTLLADDKGFAQTVNLLAERYRSYDLSKVVGIESRGFILGAALTYALGKGFVPIRKKGKLPYEKISMEYDLEYGTDTIEIHNDALIKGEKVLIIDDLLATGGTALGAAKLINLLGAEIVEFAFIIDLPELGGSKKINQAGYSLFKLIDFEGH